MTAAGLLAATLLAALRFSIPEGGVLNEFYRQGPVAAHLVATSGAAPRLVIAFPAGNSGAAVWLEARGTPLTWQPDVEMKPAELDWRGRLLRGVSVTISATGGAVSVRETIVSNIRIIREFDNRGTVPREVTVSPSVEGRTVTWRRPRLDGAGGYSLAIEVLDGSLAHGAQAITLAPDREGRLRLRVTALTGERPLTPLDEEDLLTAAASPDPRLRQILAFLSYREKLLAGSWRFNTYFGRDTLMSLRLLSPVLKPGVMEAGLGAVLERLDPGGEVAHEEDIGEFAALRRLRAGLTNGDTPLLDYKMVDDDFMLAVVAAHYLLDTPDGRGRADAFLARNGGTGERNGSALVRNLRFVVAVTADFARDPEWRNLISLKTGQDAGNWRDSEDGLGGGRYPYDVNGIFAPAALEAIARLCASGLLDSYLDARAADELRQADGMARVWRRSARPFFEVEVDPAAARAATSAYAGVIRVDPSGALAEIGEAPVRFHAVALDSAGRPVRVLNSDEAFALLFLDITAAEAERIAKTLTSAFPLGLLTDAGLLVANPVFAPPEAQPLFDRNRYHGAVIWSWQQALLRAGLDRQLGRDDLPESSREALMRALTRLQAVIDGAGEMRGSELWSWSQSGGIFQAEPFGQSQQHETESNAAQLWSAVHLAWHPMP